MSVQTFVTFKNSTFNYRLNTLRKSAQEPYRWSTSKYCLNKEKAKHDELAFIGLDIIEIEDRAEIVKATKGGFYATVHYIYLTEEEVFLDQGEYTGEDEMDENGDIQPIFTDTKTVATQREAEVVLYISDVLVDWPYLSSISYAESNSFFTIANFLDLYGHKAPDITDIQGYKLAESCEAIETNIPGPHGEKKSDGPRRVATFFFNSVLESEIINNSQDDSGCIRALGIPQLEFKDKTHNTFHKGAGNKEADLITKAGDTYEVKGPLANINISATDVNKSKDALYILHLTSNEDLILYKNINGKYVQQKTVKAAFNSLTAKTYITEVTSFVDSWEKYWTE